MKNLSVYLLSFIVANYLFLNVLKSQPVTVIDSTRLWVEINNPTLLPSRGSASFTDNSSYNLFLINEGITYYELKYASARNPYLKNFIEVRFPKKDPSIVRQALLSSVFAESINDITYDENLINDVILYDPSDYHWNWSPNGDDFLWHLKKIQADLAWDITLGDPNIRIAVFDTNYDIDHDDFTDQLVYNYDPFSLQNFSCFGNQHGTSVAGMASAETAESGTIAAGQYASVGFNTKLLLYTSGSTSTFLQKALHSVNIEGARVLVTAANGGISPCNPSACPPETAAIIDEIFNNGAVIVMPAGNGPNGYSCSVNGQPGPVGCFNPSFDSRIIVVSSTNMNDEHEYINASGQDRTHSHFPEVDLCAPGYGVPVMTGCADPGGWPYYGDGNGTSFSSPLLAGCAALVLSVNPCLEAGDVEHILKSTTDPIIDESNFAGSVGTGRVNIYQACLLAQTYGSISLNSNDITNISGNVFSSNDITVQSGMTVIVTGTLRMAADKKIIVHPGGTFIVDGGTITNSKGCSESWDGIEVWGTTGANQYTVAGINNQGRAIFRNGAVIENAWQGVMNWKPGDWNSRGGIIQASNTTFLNNRIDAIFMAYQNYAGPFVNIPMPDLSFFKECDFIINDFHLDDANVLTPRPRITLWKTDRVLIEGCNFVNEQTTVDASEKLSHAIYSHDANYRIKEHCQVNESPCPIESKIFNTFTGWHKGIEALTTESSRPISVRNSIFDQNMIGIELGGADYSEIYANEFKIGGHPFLSWGDLPIEDDQNHLGLYSNSTLHFSIEQNEFTRPTTEAPFDAHGVLIKGSQGAENEVYNNDFSRLKTGANAFQINRNTSYEGGAQVGHSGLQFKCNTNDQNEVDFEVSRADFGLGIEVFQNAGIRLRQGDFEPSLAAGNSFSTPNPNPLVYSHWTLDSHNPYFYHTTPAESPDANEIGPDQMAIQPGNQNNCPTNFTTGFTGSGGITELLIKKDEFEGLLYTYNQLIDNGNTPGTITEIELTWPQQAWQLRDQLMAVSPYNSEAVLMAAIQQNIMPHAMLLEVLLANPDALRSGQVIQFAANVPNPPMPSYMIDLLWAARDQTTLRTSLESTMADLHADVQRIQKRMLIHRAFADSTSSMLDSTLYYLSLVKTVEGNYSRAAALADRKLYSQSISLIDSMQLSYKLTNARYAEMTELKNLYGLLGAAHSSGKTIANLDSTSILSLKNIAENPNAGAAAQKAQNALCFHYSICYDAQGQPKSNGGAKKPKPTYEELLSKINTNTAYPNPTDQYVTIVYTFLHAKEESTLHIFDNLGRQIDMRNLGEVYEGQQLIDTRKLPNGVYPYQIVQDGKKVSEGKIVVTH